jgi:hypothetical protein
MGGTRGDDVGRGTTEVDERLEGAEAWQSRWRPMCNGWRVRKKKHRGSHVLPLSCAPPFMRPGGVIGVHKCVTYWWFFSILVFLRNKSDQNFFLDMAPLSRASPVDVTYEEVTPCALVRLRGEGHAWGATLAETVPRRMRALRVASHKLVCCSPCRTSRTNVDHIQH